MKKFLIKTYGCQMNFHDSEKISGVLYNNGYQKTEELQEADVILLNTCSVRAKAEQKIYSELGRFRELKIKNPNLIIAVCGCVAQQEGENLLKKSKLVDLIIGPKNILQLPELIESKYKMHQRIVSLSAAKQEPAFEIDMIDRSSPYKAYITIMEGCNKFCTFCVVPFTRGREIYRPFDNIIKEAIKLSNLGYKEICLLGQNVNSYKYQNYKFSDLLYEISKIEKIKRIRFVTSHPKDFDDDVINAVKDNSKICPLIHLPVQSGSTKILERMKRGYTRDEYLEKIHKLKKAIPYVAISTDIIVGFPGEEDKDFEETLTLIEEVKFITMFSFKYSPRPHTKALKFTDKVPEEVKEERLMKLQSRQKIIQYQLFSELVGEEKEVLVEGFSQRDNNELAGRTVENIVVNFPADKECIGKIVKIKIKEAFSNSLRGELMKVLD